MSNQISIFGFEERTLTSGFLFWKKSVEQHLIYQDDAYFNSFIEKDSSGKFVFFKVESDDFSDQQLSTITDFLRHLSGHTSFVEVVV